jgi:ribosome modulation factor
MDYTLASDRMKRIYKEGIAAFATGADTCPYRRQQEKHAWVAGWQHANRSGVLHKTLREDRGFEKRDLGLAGAK